MMISLPAWMAAPAPEKRKLRLFTLTALGLLSGAICAAQPFSDSLPEFALVGIIFGIVIGGALWWMGLIRPLQVLAFIVASEACWLIAYFFAKDVTYDLIGEHWYRMMLAGILSGMLGAASLGLCCRVLFPFFRSWPLLLGTIVVGGMTGAVMTLETGFALYPLWQAGFALFLGIGAVFEKGEKEGSGKG